MAYRNSKLAMALGWKFNHQPGMTTSDGSLTGFPGAWPTDAEQAQIVSDFETYVGSSQAKDDELQVFLESAGGKVVKAMALV